MLKDDVPLDDDEPGYYRENEAPRHANQTDPNIRRSKRELRRKALAPVDHEEQEYEPFKKNFYKGTAPIQNLPTKPTCAPRKCAS